MAVASRFAGSSRALERAPCSSSLPTFAESLKVLSALVTYLRIWVDSWADTQLLATRKMKAKQRTRNETLPKSVTHGGKLPSRYDPLEEEDRLARETVGLARR